MRRRDFLKSSLCLLPATWLLYRAKQPKETVVVKGRLYSTVTLRAYPEGWVKPIKVANNADLKIGDLIELADVKYTVIQRGLNLSEEDKITLWLDRPLEEPCKKHAPLKLVEHHESLLAEVIEYNEMLKSVKLVSRPLNALS